MKWNEIKWNRPPWQMGPWSLLVSFLWWNFCVSTMCMLGVEWEVLCLNITFKHIPIIKFWKSLSIVFAIRHTNKAKQNKNTSPTTTTKYLACGILAEAVPQWRLSAEPTRASWGCPLVIQVQQNKRDDLLPGGQMVLFQPGICQDRKKIMPLRFRHSGKGASGSRRV